MIPLFLVMAGGAIGAGARHLLGGRLIGWLGTGFPFATLTVNLLGGLLMGVLVGALARLTVPGEPWRLFLGVGILGGFTTFSSFSLDVVVLIQRGDVALAIGYLLLSVIGSVLALAIGLALTRAAA